jgi:hypothetical protein
MKDDFKDYPSDPNEQKSVSDWLMHVISGKPPIEGQPSEASQTAAPRDAGAVAVQDMPRENGRAKVAEEKKKEKTVAEFTAEDLCGPAVFQMPAPAAPAKEEITADDLCWVPPSEAIKPHRNGNSAVADLMEQLRNGAPAVEAQPHKNGTGEKIPVHEPELSRAAEIVEMKAPEKPAPPLVVEAARPQQERRAVEAKEAEHHAAAEVVEEKKPQPEPDPAAYFLRDRVINTREPQDTTNFSRRTMAAAAAGDHEVTVADILRERVLRQMEPAVAPFPAKAEPVAPEAAAIAHEDVRKKEEPPVEQVKRTKAAVESQPSPPQVQEKAAPEPSAGKVERAAKPAAVAEELPLALPQVIEIATSRVEELSSAAKTESHAGVAVGAKSVFAQEGIWGDTTRVDDAAREEEPSFIEEDPMYQASKRGYLKPEELQELEHAMEEEKPENLSSALKTLVRLGSVLPWISRATPGAEGGPGTEMETGLSHEGRHEIANLRMIQYEIRSTVHDHSLQLKRMEELMIRVRESMESDTRESMDLGESMKSTAKLLRLVGIGLGVLMVVLIVMVGLGLGHK